MSPAVKQAEYRRRQAAIRHREQMMAELAEKILLGIGPAVEDEKLPRYFGMLRDDRERLNELADYLQGQKTITAL